MINKKEMVVSGNITADPDLKEVGDTFVTTFTVAVNSKKKEGDNWVDADPEFIDCKAWGWQAETIANHFEKGKPIYIDGQYKKESWEKDGQKNSRVFCIVRNFQFFPKNVSENN